LVWLRSSINVVSLLAPETQVVQDFRWFEREIGPLVPVEVVLHCDANCTLDSLQRLELLRACQARLSQIETLGGVTSAATFFPAIPRPGGLRQTIQRSVIEDRIEEYRGELVATHYLSQQEERESWRISARLKGLDDFDYRDALEQLKEQVRPVLQAYEQAGYSGIEATYTGVTPVVYQVEKALLEDLFDSFLMAFLLVTIVMSIALRSAAAGLVAMVPNIFPTLILFGIMGWLDRPVDIGTVMTASVALGMAVDGTLHFLKWYRQELARGKPARRAVLYSYQHCGGALVQTTAICALGLLVFALSDFLPARHFAITMLLLLLAALFGDLVVLPALLLSPLGRLFGPEPSAQSRELNLREARVSDGDESRETGVERGT
jgi:predicted RND superfamily exporter protein